MPISKTQHARETALRMVTAHTDDWTIGEVSFIDRQATIVVIKPEGETRLVGRSYYDCMHELRLQIEANRRAKKS